LEKLTNYDYEVIYIDNHSTDGTQKLIRQMCEKNPRIMAIFNRKNFGQFNSPYHAICQAHGDCVIVICADFQDPVELIPTFVTEWEKGYQIVCGVKTNSRENRMMYFLRTCYYRAIKRMSSFEQIEHFTGFGLYDRSFIDTLRELNDPTPFLRGIVAELGGSRKEIPYEQPLRRAGKTHNNWYSLYDAAMLSFTSYTKIGLRLALFIGFFVALLSFLLGVVYLVMKLAMWDRFIAGQAPQMIGTFFLGSIQLFFIGLVGEYIMSINNRVMNRPLVIEEERINFEPNPEITNKK
ncbi:MAG: glycosyltransferase family 2 protein, partial [Eubacteriales bacterium]|nr:glycosyltransferase family 2 protein [Eubacteriales bacterium]